MPHTPRSTQRGSTQRGSTQVWVLVVAGLLGVTSCTGEDAPAGQAVSTSESASDGATSPPPSPSGGPFGVFGDLRSLPTAFPADLPLVAGVLRLADVMDGGGFTVLVDTGLADNEAAVEGAVTLLTEAGWTLDTAASTPQLTILTKDERTLTLGVFQDDDQATLNYLVDD